jgi:hypothetical protein
MDFYFSKPLCNDNQKKKKKRKKKKKKGREGGEREITFVECLLRKGHWV